MRRLLGCLFIALPLFAADAKIEDLAWISGHWSADLDGVQMEEIWLPPQGGLMIGMHRDVKNGRASFEFLRIAATPEGIVYLAQPSGRPPTSFKIAIAERNRVVFENPAHDFPQRISYTLRDDRLCAQVEGPQDGKEMKEEWCWVRADD